MGLLSDAQLDFERVIATDKDPRKPYAFKGYDNRGRIKMLNGDRESAIVDFTASIAIRPDYSNAYLNRSWAYLELNNMDAAIQDAKRCVDLDSASSTAYLNWELHCG